MEPVEFVNCSSPGANDGTVITAEFLNELQAFIRSKERFGECFLSFFNQSDGVLQIADSVDEDGNPVFSPCEDLPPVTGANQNIMCVDVNGGLTSIPNGTIDGESVLVVGVDTGAGEYVTQSLNSAGACGTFRTANNQIQSGDFERLFLRAGETATYTWSEKLGKHIIRHDYGLASEAAWREHEGGTATIQGTVSLGAGNSVQDVALPIRILNPNLLNVQLTDVNGAEIPVNGQTPLPSERDGKHGFLNYTLSNSNISISIGNCYLGDNPVDLAPFAVNWRIDMAPIDYAQF